MTNAIRLPAAVLDLLARTVRAAARRPPSRAVLAERMFDVGNRSLVFLAVTMGFLGLILVYQGCIQASRVLPDLSLAGATLIEVMVREFGPTITALMIATRVGAGVAAEIGSMVVTDQVEAMKVCGTDPVEYVVVPRFLSCAIMSIFLTAWSIVVAVFAGMVIGATRFGIHPETFLSLRTVGWDDFTVGVIKSLVYGVVIPIVSAESGLRATGGAEGVGWATTRAVVNSSVAVIGIDFAISTLDYLIG